MLFKIRLLTFHSFEDGALCIVKRTDCNHEELPNVFPKQKCFIAFNTIGLYKLFRGNRQVLVADAAHALGELSATKAVNVLNANYICLAFNCGCALNKGKDRIGEQSILADWKLLVKPYMMSLNDAAAEDAVAHTHVLYHIAVAEKVFHCILSCVSGRRVGMLSLVVFLCAVATKYHVDAVRDCRGEIGEMVGGNRVIAIDKNQPFASCMVESQIACGAYAAVCLFMQMEARVILGASLTNFNRVVLAAIIDKQALEVGTLLLLDALNAPPDGIRPIVDGHYDGKFHYIISNDIS